MDRNDQGASPRAALHPIRILTGILGIGFIAYAASDDPLYGGPPGFGALQAAIAGLGVVIIVFAGWASVSKTMGLFVSIMVSLLCLVAFEVAGEQTMAAMVRAPYRYDHKLLFALRPGAQRAIRLIPENGGEIVVHEINRDGFRGPPIEDSPTAPRVFVYGDSFIHAEYTPEAQTFARQLEGQLSKAGVTTEVINAGVSSYGPDQVALKLESELQTYKPAVVVLAVFGGNDYGDLLRNKLFSIQDGGRLEAHPANLEPSIKEQFDLNVRESVLVKMLRRVKEQWLSAGGGAEAEELGFGEQTSPTQRVEAWLKRAREEYEDYVVTANRVVTNTHQDLYNADLSLEPQSPSARYKANLMKLVLGRIFELCEQAGVPLLLLSIPHPMDVSDAYEFSKVDIARYPGYDRRNLIRPLEEFAAERQLPHVNLFDVYRTRGRPRRFYLNGGDDHWNAEGQAVAAEAVAAALIDGPLKPASRHQIRRREP